MRSFTPSFSAANNASEKFPRFIAEFVFEEGSPTGDSMFLASHTDIFNAPNGTIGNVLWVKDARSMRIFPDQGRSEVGIVNFELLDLDGRITSEFNSRHLSNVGLRGKKIILRNGWKGANYNTQFQVFQTQIVQSVSYHMGVYSFKCADVSREQRKDLFIQKTTRLVSTISDSDSVVTVSSTVGFEMIEHGPTFSDAPDESVGYVTIEKEIISYTSLTDTTFEGCVRGALNTKAVSHTVDISVATDRRLEVKELVYLELPAPKLALALLTGVLADQSGATLPDHWHLGIASEWVKEEDFRNIGADLWDQNLEASSLCLVFTDLKKTDGKKFLEQQVYQLTGCYPVIYSDGRIGLKRMNRVVADAPFVAVLSDRNVESWGEALYDMEALANSYRVSWNYIADSPTRITEFIDSASISMHGTAERKELSFKGLYGSRHTDGTVRQLLISMWDRYANPPLRQSLKCMPHLNVLEVGDLVRNRLPLVRDFMKPVGADSPTTQTIDRTMEVQSTRINVTTGDVDIDLFGSTGNAIVSLPTSGSGGQGPLGENVLPDSFYPSQGTPLSSVVPMTLVGDVWITDPGYSILAGSADPSDIAAIYYHEGDLTISSSTTLYLTDNVQLRVGGFLTVNGRIDGVGTGMPGGADVDAYGTRGTGTPGFGSSLAMSGFTAVQRIKALPPFLITEFVANATQGLFDVLSVQNIHVIDGSPPTITGIPHELRGTGGGPGGKSQRYLSHPYYTLGGTGASGGAGFVLICRGVAFGASGVIDLSGADSVAPAPEDLHGRTNQPAVGAAGCPGAMLLLIDGNLLSYPDLSGGKFLAITGASGVPRINNITFKSKATYDLDAEWPLAPSTTYPWEGPIPDGLTDSQDMSNSALQIQYLPNMEDAIIDQPAGVPAPTNLGATTSLAYTIQLAWNPNEATDLIVTEVWEATSNDRSTAVQIAQIALGSFYSRAMTPTTTRYYWVRNRSFSTGATSDWEPSSPTGGVSGSTI